MCKYDSPTQDLDDQPQDHPMQERVGQAYAGKGDDLMACVGHLFVSVQNLSHDVGRSAFDFTEYSSDVFPKNTNPNELHATDKQDGDHE